MTSDERERFVKQAQDFLIDREIWPTCINCDNFNEEEEKCKLYDQRPPARVIVKGCPQWIPIIPF